MTGRSQLPWPGYGRSSTVPWGVPPFFFDLTERIRPFSSPKIHTLRYTTPKPLHLLIRHRCAMLQLTGSSLGCQLSVRPHKRIYGFWMTQL